MLKKISIITPITIFAVFFMMTQNLASATENNSATQNATAVLYYSPSCSHCKKVLGYLDGRNGSLAMKNISNPTYRQELNALGHKGVPVLVVGSRTITGADSIINYLAQHEELLQ